MRIYLNFAEAYSEIKRDLAEMGIDVHPDTYQDKFIRDDPNYATKELQNYMYCILNPNSSAIDAVQPYSDLEWYDRVDGIENHNTNNPGKAWMTRSDVWSQFLMPDGQFAYTYAERFAAHDAVRKVINRIREDPDSRQLYISIWDMSDINKMGGVSRIPCSLGYLIQVREGALNLTYLQRSADFATHFVNDVFFAVKLQEYIAEKTQVPIGRFSHWLGSFHVFRKDIKGVF